MPSMSATNQSRNAAAPVVAAVISGLVRFKSDEEIAEEGRKPRGEGIEVGFSEALW